MENNVVLGVFMVQTTIEKTKRVEEEKAAEIRNLEKEYSKLSQKEIFEKLDEGIKNRTFTRPQIIALANVLTGKTDNRKLKETLRHFKYRAGDNEDKIEWPECERFYNEAYGIYGGALAGKGKLGSVPTATERDRAGKTGEQKKEKEAGMTLRQRFDEIGKAVNSPASSKADVDAIIGKHLAELQAEQANSSGKKNNVLAISELQALRINIADAKTAEERKKVFAEIMSSFNFEENEKRARARVEKEALGALVYLANGWAYTDGDRYWKELRKLGGMKEEELARELTSMGMRPKTARWYAERMSRDADFMQMLRNMSENPFSDMKDGITAIETLYHVTADMAGERGITTAVDAIERYAKTPSKRAMMNFLIGRRYGDLDRTVERLNRFYKDHKTGQSMKKGRDNIETLANVLNTINTDREYRDTVTAFRKRYTTTADLDTLDILGKYAFLRMTYPEMVNTRMARDMGDITGFVDYLKGHTLPTQVQFITFSDTVPYLLDHNTADTLQGAISAIGLFSLAALQQVGWNLEKQLYGAAEEFTGAAKKSESAFLEEMINDVFKDYTSDPSFKTGIPTEASFEQHTEIERVYNKIINRLQLNAPMVLDAVQNILGAEGVKNPQTTVNFFRQLMAGEGMSLLQMAPGRVLVGTALNPRLFERYLNELKFVDAVPPTYATYGISANGAFSYETGMGYSGSQTVEYKEWGANGMWRIYGQFAGNQDVSSYTLGAAGTNVYALGASVNFTAQAMLSTDDVRQWLHEVDAYKGDMNAYSKVQVDDSQGVITYQAIGYLKKGGEYYKVASQKLTADEALEIFGGYVGYHGDVRALFREGKIKGLLVGWQVSPAIGVAFFKNKEQMSELATFSSGTTKIGARVYTDEAGAKELGARIRNPNMELNVAGGKNEGKTVYALDFAMRTGKQNISAIAYNHLGTIMGIGYQGESTYVLLDYLKNTGAAGNYGIVAGTKIRDWYADTAFYSEKRDVTYQSPDSYELFSLLDARAEILNSASAGEAEDKLYALNYQISRLRTIIGDKWSAAAAVVKHGKERRRGLEFMSGDSYAVNYFSMAPDRSYRVLCSGGKTNSLEYSTVSKNNQGMAALYTIGVLTKEEVRMLSGQYGSSSDPRAREGSGYLLGGYAGDKVAGVSAGRFAWKEPFGSLVSKWTVGIANVDYSRLNEELLSGAVGYGYARSTVDENGRESKVYYIIVNGATGEDEFKQAASAVGAELGITWTYQDFNLSQYSLTGSLRYTHLTGKDKHGNKVSIVFSGSMVKPLY